MSRALSLVDSIDNSRKPERPNLGRPLLDTKLYVPRSRSVVIARDRLTDALRRGAAQKLTLVVAPAGFGKTTLLAEWLADVAGRVNEAGWVSLDPSENEPVLFWSYVIRALQNIHPAVGTQALALLESPQAPSIEIVLTTLINEVEMIDRDFVVILDDYHVIDSAPVHNSLGFLLDHLPRRMRLVVASRSDPALPLPRLRARGELTELRAGDLRFTLDESSSFLNDVMALDVSASDTAKLERRTEGWIAGLKLAALSMKGRDDVRGFVDAFSGDNRYIADYLVEEVLHAEPEHIRRFLLGTAILDRMNGALCDTVIGETGSQALLEELERRNLFVVALDDRREWYRYHHLFADVLQKLNTSAGAHASHRRASAWYEEHGSFADAVRHALAADDVERAAALLERTWPEKNRSYESGKWLAQVKTLPNEIVRDRPVLSMGYAWALLNSGELEVAEQRLSDVERLLQNTEVAKDSGTQMVVSDEARLKSLAAELASARIYLAQALGEAPGTLEHAKRALALIPEGDHAGRATGIALVALALWGRGELEPAHRTFSEALDVMRLAGHDLDAVRGTFVLGDIRVAQGRLREAVSIYERGLQLAAEAPNPAAAETDELHLGLSEVHCEWNDLTSATKHLDAITAAGRTAHMGNRLRWGTAMARICAAYGEFDRAHDLLNEAERHERRDPVPRVRPIPALRARIRIAQGRLDDAITWASKARVSVDDALSYLHEFEHVTLARVLIARHDAPNGERTANDAAKLLERLRSAAEAGGRIGSVAEMLVLHAFAQHALGNLRGALDSLTQALALAEPEGYLRVFLDEGSRMRDLLRQAATRGLATGYSRRVLAAFDAPRPALAPAGGGVVGLLQPLTTREHEILRLIASGLRNQEIADQLSISGATVKRHIANAYGKLGVGHRTEALARANELKLL